jgi:type IV pilus assembly protein PilC
VASLPKYSYSAKNLEGDIITGVYSALDSSVVMSMIRNKNYFPLEIKRLQEEKEKREIELFPKVSLKDLALFCSQFAVVLKAGVPISQALDIMKSQTTNKKLSKVIIDVNENIQQGKTLSESFAAHGERFPRLFLSMIESGEMSGSLEASFQRMGESFGKDYKLNQKVRSVLIYPIILFVVAVCVVTFLLIFIVPTFTELYRTSGVDLPLLTSLLLNFSNFLAGNIVLIILTVAFIVIAINIYIQTTHGRQVLDHLKATMPIVGKLLKSVYAARFTRSMSTLSATGVSLPESLRVTATNLSNSYIANKLKLVGDDVNKGISLSTSLIEMNFFPPMVLHMCRLGEESGTLDNLLSQAADFYETEAEIAMGRLATLLEPFVIIFMGGAVLFIVLAILMPMFGMYSMIQ